MDDVAIIFVIYDMIGHFGHLGRISKPRNETRIISAFLNRKTQKFQVSKANAVKNERNFKKKFKTFKILVLKTKFRQNSA